VALTSTLFDVLQTARPCTAVAWLAKCLPSASESYLVYEAVITYDIMIVHASQKGCQRNQKSQLLSYAASGTVSALSFWQTHALSLRRYIV